MANVARCSFMSSANVREHSNGKLLRAQGATRHVDISSDIECSPPPYMPLKSCGALDMARRWWMTIWDLCCMAAWRSCAGGFTAPVASGCARQINLRKTACIASARHVRVDYSEVCKQRSIVGSCCAHGVNELGYKLKLTAV